MSRTLHTPDNGSTACVIVSGPLGSLYIQALDAYGFQRELSIVANDDFASQAFGRFKLKAYMHPGRRDELYLTDEQADKFVKRIEHVCAKYPSFLFNTPDTGARCNGFVHLCESIHRGDDIADIITSI